MSRMAILFAMFVLIAGAVVLFGVLREGHPGNGPGFPPAVVAEQLREAYRPNLQNVRLRTDPAKRIDVPACGQSIRGDLLLDQDIDCSHMEGDVAFRIAQSDVVIDCAGHSITAPEEITNVIEASQEKQIGLYNCELIGAKNGLSLFEVQESSIRNNTVRGCRDNGIHLSKVRELELSDNEVFVQSGALAGIECAASERLEFHHNQVHGFRLGGIQFYGSHRIYLHHNVVYGIGDTGFGFFEDPVSGNVTREMFLWKNEAFECSHVGAVEILSGSRDLVFLDNNFHDSAKGFYIYNSTGRTVTRITLEGNRIASCQEGISISDQSEYLVIHRNHFIDNLCAIGIKDSKNIHIRENRIEIQSPDLRPGVPLINLAKSRQIQFTQNVFLNTSAIQNALVCSTGSSRLDFSENHWNGCPDLKSLLFDDKPGLRFINPIDLNPSPSAKTLYQMEDNDADGLDDHDCRGPLPLDVKPGQSP